MVAISIPVFTTQLEKSRDAVTVANLRSAYAQAAADVLTADNPASGMTEKVVSKGTQAGWSGDVAADLPFALGSGTSVLENTPNTYDVTFTFAADGTCTATIG